MVDEIRFIMFDGTADRISIIIHPPAPKWEVLSIVLDDSICDLGAFENFLDIRERIYKEAKYEVPKLKFLKYVIKENVAIYVGICNDGENKWIIRWNEVCQSAYDPNDNTCLQRDMFKGLLKEHFFDDIVRVLKSYQSF
jgi:hypothetical protein